MDTHTYTSILEQFDLFCKSLNPQARMHVRLHACVYINIQTPGLEWLSSLHGKLSILIYIHTYIYICIYIYTHTYTNFSLNGFLHFIKTINPYAYMYMYIYIYIYVCMYACMHVCVYIYIYTYTYKYTHINTLPLELFSSLHQNYQSLHIYTYMIYLHTYIYMHTRTSA